MAHPDATARLIDPPSRRPTIGSANAAVRVRASRCVAAALLIAVLGGVAPSVLGASPVLAAEVARPLATTTIAPTTAVPTSTPGAAGGPGAPEGTTWSGQVVQTDQLPEILAQQARARSGIAGSSESAATDGGGTNTATPTTTRKVRATTKRRARTTTTTAVARVIAATGSGTAAPAVQANTPGANTSAANRSPAGSTVGSDGSWAALRGCESGNRYTLNTGNGYYGAYQFSASTWRRLGYAGFPHEASPAVQDEAARKLQAKSGWGQWPACARKLGLL